MDLDDHDIARHIVDRSVAGDQHDAHADTAQALLVESDAGTFDHCGDRQTRSLDGSLVVEAV